MAEVYLAHDKVLNRDVALKVLRDQYASNGEFVERFRREARNAAALSHPNIVPVYDAGKAEDGTPYIAMEYMAGGTLGELIAREGTLETTMATMIAIEVARALREAHRCGVVHRDVKSHNIFLAGSPASPNAEPEGFPLGAVKVGDFGIARAAEASTMTESNLVLGTPLYLSPEQANGKFVGPKSRGDPLRDANRAVAFRRQGFHHHSDETCLGVATVAQRGEPRGAGGHERVGTAAPFEGP